MKLKLTSLMFGLLLAVGWTSNVFAQPATYKAEDMVGWTYTWEDANGNTQTSNYVKLVTKQDHFGNSYQAYETEEVTNAHQIYGLLRSVYMDKRFPGPTYSAYKADGTTREGKVYYGGTHDGWEIPGVATSGSNTNIGALTINISNPSYGYVYIESIKIISSTEVISSWDYATNGQNVPWTTSRTPNYDSDGWMYFTRSASITIPASMTAGRNSVEVHISASFTQNQTNGSISINTKSKTINSTGNYYWNFNAGRQVLADNTYAPNEDGYTALVVAMKNTSYIAPEPSFTQGSTGYQSRDSIINYISKNIQFVKLLTDGLRINDGDAPGTVFNCDGSYNKFFFLGKGKARTKGQEVLDKINAGDWPYYTGECIIFWPLFEEFSPTTGKLTGSSSVVDFYDRMMEGQTYKVVHDCAAVIQNRHEFTLAGEDKTDDYPFTGMNFFIPDYRLKYYVGRDSTTTSGVTTYYDVDGRDMNAYYQLDGTTFRSLMFYYCNFAQYNPDYAPKVGIYKITLKAIATQVGDSHEPNNQNFVVTLTWVSSLNEMSGTTVPQTYTIYVIDNVTGEETALTATGVTNPTGQTTVSYLVPQREHSYTIKYIVMGSPNDSDHPNYVAWSNTDMVVIPGWDDFVGLVLDHHESDFEVDEMANYYRNFLTVVNPDTYNGLTVSKVQEGMNEFTLYRYTTDANNATPVAKITFGTPTADGVPYTVTYLNEQKPLETPKYNLDENHLNIPLTGMVRIKGNGDIVIWPNGYHVNFKSITVKNNGTAINGYTWTTAMSNLPNTMKLSDGSVWEEFTNTSTNDFVGYIEGGGYIYIPGILNTYPNATVEIVCYGDGANVSTITVNDAQKTIANNAANTYTWGPVTQDDEPLSPYAAPKRDRDNHNNNSNN